MVHRLLPKVEVRTGDADQGINLVFVGQAVPVALAREQIPADREEPACLVFGGDDRELPEGLERPEPGVWCPEASRLGMLDDLEKGRRTPLPGVLVDQEVRARCGEGEGRRSLPR
jgi:hypothetical protein